MQPCLIQYIFVEVGHVAMVRNRTVIIILEVLLQGNRVMWDVQNRVQVVGKDLRRKNKYKRITLNLLMLLHSAMFPHKHKHGQLPVAGSMSGQLSATSWDSSEQQRHVETGPIKIKRTEEGKTAEKRC